MAKKKTKSKQKKATTARSDLRARLKQKLRWLGLRAGLFVALALLLYAFVPVLTTPYIIAERIRSGAPIERDWVAIEDVSAHVARSIVASEDANFCTHWGFDIAEIRAVIAQGQSRGASTLTQQTVKNVYLWHGRSYVRKAFETLLTPLVEISWSKRRIVEVYMNVAEFDQNVFGIQAAARHYFDVDAADLSASQAARLASVLPNPKARSASNPTSFLWQRAEQIMDGAATIQADGRSSCFED